MPPVSENRIGVFERELLSLLPATYDLLASANLTVHPAVERIVLHGSRGLAGGDRPESDLDLSLLVDPPASSERPEIEALLNEVVETTLRRWRGAVPVDLAVVYDTRRCALACFDRIAWHEGDCAKGAVDCFGLYKVQKGFNGLVTNAGIQVKRMHPCLTIWRRTRSSFTIDLVLPGSIDR